MSLRLAHVNNHSITRKQLLACDWSGRIKAFHAVKIIWTKSDKNQLYLQNMKLPSASNKTGKILNKNIKNIKQRRCGKVRTITRPGTLVLLFFLCTSIVKGKSEVR